mgnify:FL=1
MEEFERLLEAERPPVERFVRFRISSKMDADDVLQEVFLTAYQKFSQLRDWNSFKPWILRIARNKCNDYFRQRAKMLEIPWEEINEKVLSHGRFGLTETSNVQETLSKLSDQDQQILNLFFFYDLSQAEISETLHIPLGTVKSRLHTAKQHFKSQYPYPANVLKGENSMNKLPGFLPEYRIEKSEQEPFPVIWEELWGLFIVPREGESLIWGRYDPNTRKCAEWGEMTVLGKAQVHGVEGVEIKEYRHNHFGPGKDDMDHYYVAQLTDTHCRILAENYLRDGVRNYLTFLDGDKFLAEWGYGENNCGKETHVESSHAIVEQEGVLLAQNADQLCDIVGRFSVSLLGKTYDTVRVISLDSYYGQYVACEQYLDRKGRTILWRRFNRDDWNIDQGQKKWSEQYPDHDRLTINGTTYTHWYDCITDYILT